MFFLLKKLAQTLLLPPTSLFLMILAALILMIRNKRRGRYLLILALVLFYALSIGPVSNGLLRGLENRYAPVSTPPPGIDTIVVLGGGVSNPASRLPVTSRLSPSTLARTTEAVRLFGLMERGRMITIGGSWPHADPKEQACSLMKDFAVLMGVDGSRISVLCDSRDTAEEAGMIRRFVGEEDFLLVTSAYHMDRACLLFREAGMTPIPAPCDFHAQGERPLVFFDFFPRSDRLELSSFALKEYLGLFLYRIF